MRLGGKLVGGAAALAIAAIAFAQSYPSKPIRVIVPWGNGSGPDVAFRIVAAELSPSLGQQLVIDNRPGAGGTIGTAMILKAPPDGYTLGHVSIATAIGNSLYPNLSYDLKKDGDMIGDVLRGANVLAVRLSLPVNTFQEFITYAKQNPGKLTYGSPGSGTSLHLSMELLKLMTGIQLEHVPFRDAQGAITAMMGGQVDVLFENFGSIVPHVKAGRVRGLAVTGPRRSAALPDLPTVSESGLPGFEVTVWAGFMAPRGTPKHIVAKLNTELNRALASASVQERFARLGYEPMPGTPEQFDAFVRTEVTRWADVAKRVGARVD